MLLFCILFWLCWVNVPVNDIVNECMMCTSICESDMPWYVYVLRKMLGEPSSCRIRISKGIQK